MCETRTRPVALAVLAALTIWFPSVATAQNVAKDDSAAQELQSEENAEDSDSPPQNRIEEVVVYGTKRSAAETVQSVPAQIAAFGSRQLEARHVITLEDLSFATPNVQLEDIRTAPGTANFTIRGQGINSSIPSIDPTVGVFIDGVYAGVTSGLVTDMFDMESVEIHKGPQGVLFGRNVTAGAILLRSARPSGEFGLKSKFGIETGLQMTAAASVEGSLIEDRLAGKLSVYYKDDDGYFPDPTVGRDVGKEETVLVRPTLVFKPRDGLEATMIFEHGKMKTDGPIAQSALGASPGHPRGEVATVIDNPGTFDLTWNQLTFETHLDVGDKGNVTNILGWRDVESDGVGEIDGIELQLFDASVASAQDQISNELRYSGYLTDAWEITAGLYYFTSDLSYREGRSLFFGSTRIGGGGDQDHEIWGVFVNNFYDVSNDVTLQLGLRYSEEKKDAEIWPLGFCSYADLDDCAAPRKAGDRWSNVSPKIGVQWNPSESVMLYGHWARGYRAGGFNFRTPLAEPKAFGPERTDGFELGVKSDFPGIRMRLNSAIFVNKVTEMQREVNLQDPDIGVFQDIDNTADATITGFEIDTVFRATGNLTIRAGVGYLDGTYDEVRADLNGDGVVGDSADRALEIPRLAKWTYNMGMTCDLHLGQLGTVVMRGDYSHRDRAPFTDNNQGFFNAYDMIDGALDWEPAGANWSVSVYGRNLGDEAVLGNVTPLPFPALGFADASYFAPMQKGRRFGADLHYAF